MSSPTLRQQHGGESTKAMLDGIRFSCSTLDTHGLMRSVVERLLSWSACDAVGIRLRDGDDYPYFEQRGFSAEFLRTENSLCHFDGTRAVVCDAGGHPVLDCMCGNVLCGRVDPAKPFFTARGSFWSNDTTDLLATTTEADRQARTRNKCNGEGYESVLLVPLRSADEVFGLVQLNSHRRGCFTAEMVALVEDMADGIGAAIAERRAKEALRKSEERYRTLFENMLEGFAYCQMLYDDDGVPSDWVYLVVNSAFSTLTGLKDAVGKRVTELLPGIHEQSPELFEIYGRTASEGTPQRFEIDFTPLSRWFDVAVSSPESGHFVAVFQDVSERKRAEAALQRQALNDELTMMPNRRAFDEEVEKALREGSADRIGVLILDLDRFKEINDSLGHPAGDRLLKMIAARLTRFLRPGDTLARLGGDEFAVLVRDGALAESEAVAGRLRAALREPFLLDAMLLPITASIGIAIAPEHGSRPWELLAHADTAMYQAKRLHTGVEVFDPGDGDRSRGHLEFQAAFYAALEHEELVVYYQPKIDLTDDRVVGVEALVRWNRPGRGLVTPDRFLHLVQETGMMSRITCFVLGQAARDCQLWRELGHDISLSVNVPASNLVDMDLPDTVLSLIERAGLAPESLIVEITEDSLMLDRVRSVEVLERLRAAGVRVSIDDYGTGFTSVGQLHHLPIDELKLDRSFVTDLLESHSHEAIVHSTIELGHALGFEMVAEGIESAAVLERLREMGCNLGQGYHIMSPAPAHDLLAYLEKNRITRHAFGSSPRSSGTRDSHGDVRLRVLRGRG